MSVQSGGSGMPGSRPACGRGGGIIGACLSGIMSAGLDFMWGCFRFGTGYTGLGTPTWLPSAYYTPKSPHRSPSPTIPWSAIRTAPDIVSKSTDTNSELAWCAGLSYWTSWMSRCRFRWLTRISIRLLWRWRPEGSFWGIGGIFCSLCAWMPANASPDSRTPIYPQYPKN